MDATKRKWIPIMSNKSTIAATFAFATLAGLSSYGVYRMGEVPTMNPSSAAWANIGGCGSSGGGAAAGAGKWVGRGVSGGLVDMELLGNSTIGGDYLYNALNLSFTLHWPAHPNYTANLSISSKSNQFEYEGFKVGEDITPRLNRITGGLGDFSLGLNRLFGDANEHSAGLSFTLPTGQHDIKRLHAKSLTGTVNDGRDDTRWMSPFVQPGAGLYNASLSYEYTSTKDWGLVIWGASYSAAFAWDNWGCRDQVAGTIDDKVLSCQSAAPSGLTWKLWELQHQEWGGDPKSWTESYGAPGTGATGADGLSIFGYIGHKEEASTQNVGLTLSVPLAPTYYWEYGSVNRMSTRIRTNDYTLKLSAGLEITNPDFPIFLSFGLPYVLNDIIDRGRLVAPQNYIGTVGIKGTFF
jgi:hypothetical protein